MTCEISFLLIFELLRLFVKTLTPDARYSPCNICHPQELYQMLLSKKLKTFRFFYQLLQGESNFQHVGKQDHVHSVCISEIRDCERHG